jgi:ABC-type microcin C transport system duplicated ATPase subunit YejF
MPEQRMRSIRGKDIAMIFQEPMTSLNPVLTVGEQIAETVMQHERLGWRAGLDRAGDMLRLVGIPEPGGGCTSTRTSSRAACASGS